MRTVAIAAPFQGTEWPRRCTGCDRVTYHNPIPVAVVLLPVGAGVLTVRRKLGRTAGQLALPGGFIDGKESWQEAAARELREEAGVTIDAEQVRDFYVRSAPDGTLLVFGEGPQLAPVDLEPFEANEEVSERVIVESAIALAFPLHSHALSDFLRRRAIQDPWTSSSHEN